MNKKYFTILLVFIILLSSCWTDYTSIQETWNENTTTIIQNENINDNMEKNTNEDNNYNNNEASISDYDIKQIDLNLKDKETIIIKLDSENTNIVSDSIQVSWQEITIKKSWNYEFSWTLSDGQIIVETGDEKDVQIILNWVNITSTDWSAILVNEANQTIINLANNSINNIIDWENYINVEDENAAIFSKDDLVINWNWTLNINWNYKDWITSKDKLFIDSGNINITAKDDWIRWKDYILINDWNIDIIADWDGLKSDNDDKWTILINWWNINISSWDDWINAALYVVINDWNINVDESYEAIEAMDITFNGWNINLFASDDWINAVWWDDSGIWEQAEEWVFLRINWWIITLNSQWDWLDSNGDIIMTWWNVTVYWPTQNNNWSLDYNWDFNVYWGSLIAIWSSWMAQNIWTNSSQYWVLIWFDSSISAWKIFQLKDNSWNIITNITTKKTSQAIVISNPALKNDEKYSYYINWETIGDFIISNITTTVWNITEKATRWDKWDRMFK